MFEKIEAKNKARITFIRSGAHQRDDDMADAQMTDEKEERLRTILEIIWEKRKKIAKGRKIRRVKEFHGG